MRCGFAVHTLSEHSLSSYSALSCGSSIVDGLEVDVERQPGRVPEEAVAPVQALSL